MEKIVWKSVVSIVIYLKFVIGKMVFVEGVVLRDGSCFCVKKVNEIFLDILNGIIVI